ncbi:G2-specific protein kinase nimA [Elsinoe australis]|uniref:non-specific serine/threonine protein kinase n=1 Tax=Elsinoe australis TaxID=40998 RepID=A0A4U7AYB1_9PEZI|nr:G2-specific protein kinase nimA [Elsinoe australis]
MATEADKYEVLERIGQGSFGVIRKVRRKQDGLILCRKEICYTKMSDKERHQLQAELNILRQLDHPNIVHYYEKEHHKESHDLHLYMEYCGNGDLGIMIKDLKNRHAYADEEFVWTIFAQIVSALYRCHYGEDPPSADSTAVGLAKNALPIKSKQACDRMILHRDLKPENVFLGDGNAVKLGDFGLSKIISSHDFASTYVGTPFYMSPEICAAERYSLYSDIWSLGCVIYELCAREPPFNAKTHFDLIQKIKLGKVSPLPRTYSRELSEVITACLQVNPNSRPDTAALLNLPRVKLIRKSQQSALILQQHILDKDQAIAELRLAKEHIMRLEAERQVAYDEMNKKLHMEWETRAHLEIQRQVDIQEQAMKLEMEKQIAAGIAEGVAAHLISQSSSQATSATSFTSSQSSTIETQPAPRSSTPTSLIPKQPSRSSLPTLSETSPSRPADLSTLSLEDSPLSAKPKPMKRSSRTPFTRARTIANAEDMLPSPMDIQMADPSPIRNIAGLSLSPRRAAAIESSGLRQPAIRGNIFAQPSRPHPLFHVDAADRLPHDIEDFSDEEDDADASETDSPTRAKAPVPVFEKKDRPLSSGLTAAGAGGLGANLGRPSMLRQKTTPAPFGHGRMKSAGTNVFALAAQQQTVSAPQIPTLARPASPRDVENVRPGSPNRKVATGAGLMKTGLSSPVRKAPGVPAQGSPTARKLRDGGEVGAVGLEKAIANRKVQGRTLVELSRDEVVNVQGGARSERNSWAEEKGCRLEPATWDPERDEMPSPFLVRGRRIVAGR